MTKDDIEFVATVSARYHRRRAAFLERAGSAMSVLTLLGGAGAFLAVVGDKSTLGQASAVVIIAIGIIQIVFKTEQCANEHRHWLRAWNDMLREVNQSDSPDATILADWVKRKFEIEGQCVAEMRALANDSYNRTMNELKRDGDPYVLTSWQRLWMQLVPFENAPYR
jgi:hypothetical protein